MKKELKTKRVRRFEAVAGACCFAAGILAALLGSLLTASSWITGVEVHPWIHGAGTALLILTIPLILFAGFCLDWAERTPTRASDNDRHPGHGKTSPDSVVISKEIKRGVEGREVEPETSIPFDKSRETYARHSGSINSEGIERAPGGAGKQIKHTV